MTDAVKIDVTKLTPLSPEVISKQATINIGNDNSFEKDKAQLGTYIKFFYRYYWSRSSR